MKRTASAAFEVEAKGVEEFLQLLSTREAERAATGCLADAEAGGGLRRAVYVARLQDVRYGEVSSFPYVRRYVHCAFPYGEDLVTFEEVTSREQELPHSPPKGREDPRERQQRAYEKLRTRIEGHIRDERLRLPVVDAYLHHSSNPRASL